jgi:4-hydroxy-2-oxoheptanedioate aldolase
VGSFNSATANFGIMVASGSPAIAEAVAASGVDWLCIDAQHGAVTYEVLGNMLAACSSHGARVIVRVGGPSDRFGIQQALDLGAHGIMVPLVNSRADAEEAVSYCLFAPAGQRSVAYPVRSVCVYVGRGYKS